jgi:hypothetical protein
VADGVSAALSALTREGAQGSFVTRDHLEPDALSIEVRGVGRLKFPVSTAAARKLIGVATRSHFGWREHTLMDLDVRDSWEVAKSRV